MGTTPPAPARCCRSFWRPPHPAAPVGGAACSGSDVVVILEKVRITLQELRIEAAGVRREGEPRRYQSIHLNYRMRGTGLDEAKARRAIDLSLEKYCSVVHSLAPDIALTYALSLG